MKKKFLPLLLALCLCLALLSVTANAEGEIRYLWQADDDGKIYWSTTIPSDLTAQGDGTALEEATLELSSSISYPVYRLPEGSYVLLGDITLSGTLLAYDDITLDLNGQMLALTESAESGSIIYMQSGNLTLKSCDTESPHKFDTSGDVWKLAASEAEGDKITIVEGGVLTGGKGMKPTASADVSTGGAVCVLSGDFTMENCNIVGCTAGAGGAVYVRQLSGCSFTFTMTGSRIMDCTASGGKGSSSGGAVYSGAAFTMSNSVIEACKSVSYGGGIYVSNTVTLKSGSVIKNCTASNGGGVYVYNVGGLQMDAGAVIENCTATTSGGGVYLTTGSGEQHKMAGTITGCKATGNGGGVYYNFTNEKVLTISGTIEKCSAANGGGVYFPANNSTPSRTVILKGGTITGCEATGNGGGVYVDGNKLANCPNTFELDSGSITGCTATNGGGVYLGCDSKAKVAPVFTMGGGSITGCNATGNGGGVYAGNYDGSLNSTVKLSGGEIKGNNAGSDGGGIYVETSNLTVRGSVEVTDNVSGGAKNAATGLYEKGESGAANNIFLPDSYTLSFLMVTGGKVGFSFQSDLCEGMTVAEGGNTASPQYCVFDGDDDNEWALYEEGGAYLAGKKTVLLTHEGSTTGYVKFNAAYDAAADGDTLTLLADATTDDKGIKKNLTIQLNGHGLKDSLYIYSAVTIAGTGSIDWLQANGTSVDVTLKDGVTITSNAMVTGGKLTVENAEIKESLSAGSALASGTLTMSGGSAKNLNVYPNSTVTLTGGTFDSISRMALSNEQNPTLPGTDYSQTPTFGAMLASGYAFKSTDGTWYDKNNNNDETGISNVEVKPLPITSVTLAADRAAADGQTYPTYPYGEEYDNGYVTTTIVKPEGEEELKCEYFVDGRSTGHQCITYGKTTTDTYSLSAMTVNGQHLSVGTHTIYVVATKDGYTLQSNTVTVKIAKGTLTESDYTAPTAKTLTYNNGNQDLVSPGTIYSDCTMYYKLGDGEWSDTIPQAKDAGTYTVYWYIDGGDNYNDVGSETKPVGSIEVTIAPKTVTPTVMVANGSSIYDGNEQEPAVVVTDDGTPISESEYSVAYSNNINAGTGTVTVTCKEGGNYVWTEPVTQNFTIQKAAAPTGVSATVAEILYTKTPYTVDLSKVITGMPEDAGTVSYSLPNGTDIASISGNTLTISEQLSGEPGASIDVPVTVSSANYADATVTVTIRLVAKTQKTLTDVKIDGWTYGDTPNTPSYTENTGMIGTATISSKRKGADDSTYTNVIPTDAGDYTVRVTYETATEIWSGTADFTIARKTITQEMVEVGSLTYTGSAQSPTVTVTDGSKTLTKDTDYTVDVTAQTNAGDYTLTVTGAGNYQGTAPKAWSIARAALSVSVTASDKEYDGTTNATVSSVTFDGLQNGETLAEGTDYTVTAEFADANYIWENPTEVSYTVTLKDSGTAKNYAFSTGTGTTAATGTGTTTATIQQKTITATVTVADKEYDGNTDATVTLTVDPKDLCNGDRITLSGLTGTFSDADVGDNKSVTISGHLIISSDNYLVSYNTDNITASIKPAKATVTTAPTAKTLTYTGAAQALVTAGAASGGTMQYSLDGNIWSDSIPTGTNATGYTVYYKVKADSNHSDSEPASVPVTIGKASLTVTAMAKAITYGDAPDNNGVTCSGFVNSETATVLGGTPTYSYSYEQYDKVGNYTITPDGLTSNNYAIEFKPGTLTVSQKEVSLDWTNTSLTYTGSAQAPTATATGLVGSDSCTVTVTGAQTNAGTGYTATADSLSNGNYKLPESGLTTGFSIAAASLTGVSAEQSGTLTYTGSAQSATVTTAATTVDSSAVSFTYSTEQDGTYSAAVPAFTSGTHTVYYKASADNHETASGSFTVTVGKATVTVTAADKSAYTYASAPDLSSPVEGTDYTLSGLIGEDTLSSAVSIVLTCAADMSKTGSYDIVPSVTGEDARYDFAFVSGKLTVSNRPSSGTTTVTVSVSSDHDTVNVKATVSGSNAKVEVSDAQIDQVAADGAGSVTVDVSSLQNVTSATVPSHVVEKTNEAEDTALTVALPTGSVSLDETALESVTETAKGKDVTVSVVAIPTASVAPVVKDIIGMEPSVVAVVDVNITVNGIKKSSFSGGKITISIPYTPKKGEDTSKLTVWFIRDDGTIENKGGYYDAENKCFVFETEHLSQYVLLNAPTAFTDVPVEKYFYPAVNWAVANSITGGTTATTFSPYASCTRGQLVTFLWRAAGKPEAKSAENPFTDVKETSAFYKAILWAAENGIVTGYSDGTFKPSAAVSRQQTAAILYRYAKCAGMDVTVGEDTNILSYSDALSVSEYAVSAFQWAVGEGVITGNAGSLLPHNTCTRAQIVTMLYRLLAK